MRQPPLTPFFGLVVYPAIVALFIGGLVYGAFTLGDALGRAAGNRACLKENDNDKVATGDTHHEGKL